MASLASMSRSFVRESDGDGPDDLPELPLSPHPNYVTPRGLAQLQSRLQTALAARQALDASAVGAAQDKAGLAREIRWLQARLASALPQRLPAAPQKVGFGVVVGLEDTEGARYRYQIVGEDEADPEQGYVSWLSPLAQAVEGKTVGDEVVWPRPRGDVRVEILDISAAG
jgi:transcription elongation GreA/GreB family factor